MDGGKYTIADCKTRIYTIFRGVWMTMHFGFILHRQYSFYVSRRWTMHSGYNAQWQNSARNLVVYLRRDRTRVKILSWRNTKFRVYEFEKWKIHALIKRYRCIFFFFFKLKIEKKIRAYNWICKVDSTRVCVKKKKRKSKPNSLKICRFRSFFLPSSIRVNFSPLLSHLL